MTLLHKVTLAVCALPLAGCGNKPKPAENNISKKAKPGAQNLPSAVKGKGWKVRWTTQSGDSAAKTSPLLIAEMEEGEIYYQGEVPALRMSKVKAQLFQDGVLSANIEAGRMEANRKEGRIIGTKGVAVHTLVAPNQTQVTADRVTWDAKKRSALAEGAARLERGATDKTRAISVQAPKIWMDVKTGEFRVLGGTE